MNFLLLVFAVFGFLTQVTRVSSGGRICGYTHPGRCRLHCDRKELAMFQCDRYKQCCVDKTLLPVPVMPPPYIG